MESLFRKIFVNLKEFTITQTVSRYNQYEHFLRLVSSAKWYLRIARVVQIVSMQLSLTFY